MHLWNLYYNQNHEHFHHSSPQSFLVLFITHSSLLKQILMFLSLYINLHFIEFYIDGIIQCVLLFNTVGFAQYNTLKLILIDLCVKSVFPFIAE